MILYGNHGRFFFDSMAHVIWSHPSHFYHPSELVNVFLVPGSDSTAMSCWYLVNGLVHPFIGSV